jgi:hypothetical protein
MYKILNKGLIILFFVITSSNYVFGNLPENISELVDSSAPAVVKYNLQRRSISKILIRIWPEYQNEMFREILVYQREF